MISRYAASVAMLLADLLIVSARADDIDTARDALAHQDYATAFRLARPSATQALPPAELIVAAIYETGFANGTPEQALNWYRRAADHGMPEAQDALGRHYRDGKLVAQDYAEALTWFHKAADTGSTVAAADLGQMYRDGLGVPKDVAEARHWFQIAADKGNFLGQLGLASLH